MAETLVEEKVESPVEKKKNPAPKDKPDLDRENDVGKKPPKKGPCVRCGNDVPINRLMLCYRCWVITNLQDEAKARGEHWSEGMDHPATCKCEGLGEHKNKDGTARGFN